MDWAAFDAFMSKWGFQTICIVAAAWFFLKEIWPIIKGFINELPKQLQAITGAIESMTETVEKQQQTIKEHMETSNRLIEEMRKGRK